MPFIETSIIIPDGDKNKIWEMVKAIEGYTLFMEDVESIEVLEENAEENWQISKWVTRLEGRRMEWTEKDVWDDDTMNLKYHQIEGDLSKFEGEWVVVDTEDGVKVTLTVDFDLGIPMFASLLNPIAKILVQKNSRAMLAAIKAQATKA